MSKIVLNRQGVRELLRSEEMKAICEELAEDIKQRTGIADGFEVTTFTGINRVNASVHAITDEALEECLKNNILLTALGGNND